MRKYLTALLFGLFLPAAVAAQEASGEEETNAFGYPDKSLVRVIENNFASKGAPVNPKPECSDPRLAEQARKAIEPYIVMQNRTIVDRRRTQLILKNTDNFIPLEIADVSPQNHRRLAGRLVELKINNHLANDNFKVCQSDNPILKTKIYLLMYDNDKQVKTEIINFSDKNIPQFVFTAE